MITEWTTPFVEAKDEYISWLRETFVDWKYPDYGDLLRHALELVRQRAELSYGQEPDPERIHTIDDGEYQGLLVFVIGATGYQPDTYWYTHTYYGSCSGCDALEDAWGYGDEHDYEGVYLLALHMLQRAKPMVMVDG